VLIHWTALRLHHGWLEVVSDSVQLANRPRAMADCTTWIAYDQPAMLCRMNAFEVHAYRNRRSDRNAIDAQLTSLDWPATPNFLINGLKREQLIADQLDDPARAFLQCAWWRWTAFRRPCRRDQS